VNVWRRRDMGFTLTPAALDKLAEAGFDPVVRRRPLKRRHPATDRESAGDGNPVRQVQRGDTILAMSLTARLPSTRKGAQEGRSS